MNSFQQNQISNEEIQPINNKSFEEDGNSSPEINSSDIQKKRNSGVSGTSNTSNVSNSTGLCSYYVITCPWEVR
jgi:hypothetical protein